jgi:hypothetical protein
LLGVLQNLHSLLADGKVILLHDELDEFKWKANFLTIDLEVIT